MSQDNDSSECVQEGRIRTSQIGDGGISQIKLLLVDANILRITFYTPSRS